MIRNKVITGILAAMAAIQVQAQPLLRSNVHIGFIYPLSTNGVRAADYSNLFSVHAIAGVSRSEEAFCASGVANVVKDSAEGFLGAGVANVVGGSVNGCQAAGVVNATGGWVTGAQLSGFINIAGSVNGIQAAGFANIATHKVQGVQASGFFNSADTANTQLGGFVNIARNVNTQVAGFVNVADEVTGAQVAGFINIARKVKGTQIAGFINIADSSNNPIGIINIIGNGEQAIGVTMNETGTSMLTFRSGGKNLYGILGVGGNFTNGYRAYAFEAGIGTHIPVSRTFRFNAEIYSSTVTDHWFNNDYRSGIRFMPSLRFGNLEVFAGPSVNYTGSADIQGTGRVGYSLWDYRSANFSHDLSIGMNAGLQYHFNSKNFVKRIIDQKNNQLQ